MRRGLSKFFYQIGWKWASRKCDPVTYATLAIGQITEALEGFANMLTVMGNLMGSDGGQNEENTTAQEEE